MIDTSLSAAEIQQFLSLWQSVMVGRGFNNGVVHATIREDEKAAMMSACTAAGQLVRRNPWQRFSSEHVTYLIGGRPAIEYDAGPGAMIVHRPQNQQAPLFIQEHVKAINELIANGIRAATPIIIRGSEGHL